jgi:hypothetical protein
LGAAAIKQKLASPIPLDFKKYRLSIISYLKKAALARDFGQFAMPIMPTIY